MSAYLRSLGLAYKPGPQEAECLECAGAGYFSTDNGPAPGETDCEVCGGTGYIEKEDDEMDEITEATQRFNAAVAAYKEHEDKSRELNLDLAIAKRGGDAEQIATAEAAVAEHGKGWHTAYKGEKETALILVNALGVDASRLRWALG